MGLISRIKTWINKEVLTHTDLNVEFDNITGNIVQATASVKGMIELATDAEIIAGTDTERAITPANVTAKIDTDGTLAGNLDTHIPSQKAVKTYSDAKFHFKDIFSDYVVDGLLPVTSTDLTSDISAGQAYVKGKRIDNAVTSNTYTASVDTYVDVDYNGAYTFPEVALGAAAPAVTADSIRLAKVVTDADNITGVTDLRTLETQLTDTNATTAAANLTDNAIIVGDGGAKGVKTLPSAIADTILSGTPKVFTLYDSAGTPYYFKTYPTKV